MVASLPDCRVLVDPVARDGAWNMAMDAVLLETALCRELCSLRLYRWDSPTVSLGYFQDVRAVSGELCGLAVVRRLSGGGAIVHDRELTYSCALPASHPLAQRPLELYACVHQQVIEALSEFDVVASLRGRTVQGRSDEFLCFGRGDAFDVVIDESKILGSAQRRRKGAILQHGSLILERSPYAPQFPGVCDLTAATIEVGALTDRIAERVGALLSDSPARGAPFAMEIQRAEQLLQCEA